MLFFSFYTCPILQLGVNGTFNVELFVGFSILTREKLRLYLFKLKTMSICEKYDKAGSRSISKKI